MHVSDILTDKGRPTVITIGPNETMETAARLLHTKHIGALIVCDGDDAILGVLSERDIARAIAVKGPSSLAMPVSQFMTAKVVGCKSSDSIAEVMKMMSAGHFRHMPVIEESQLKGMVSIGDVIKYRLDESEQEASALRDYVLAGH